MQAITLFPNSEVSTDQRRTLLAAAMGWGLDGFDVMLYSNVQVRVVADLGITSKSVAGLPNTLMLLAAGMGGIMFGFIADRIGRKKALMLSILTYSACSLGSGFSTSILVLVLFRFLLGLGMGGEWNTGITLVAETWPIHLRAKAIAVVQSAWALGMAAAAVVAGVIQPMTHWRVVFFLGVLPALLTLWIRHHVPESDIWNQQASSQRQAPFSDIFARSLRKSTIVLLLLNVFGQFAWWGLFVWMPPYLTLPVDKGGRGLGIMNVTWLLVILNLAGMFPGYLCYGWIADHLGRRRTLVIFAFSAALLLPIYSRAQPPSVILVSGTLVAFFGTGFFAGFGLIGSEIFPTSVRALALGFTYNGARMLSCIAPYTIGWVGDHKGLNWAFWLCAAAYVLTALTALQLPETKGKQIV